MIVVCLNSTINYIASLMWAEVFTSDDNVGGSQLELKTEDD